MFMSIKRISGIITALLLVLCIISTQIKNTIITSDTSDYTNSGNVGQLSEGTAVEFDYKANGETIRGYNLLFATYGEKITEGIVHINVYDKKSDKLLGSGKVNADAIEDNEMTLVKTGHINLKNKQVRVIIYCEGFSEDKLVTLWLGNSDENSDGETYVNGMRLDNNLLIFSQKVTKEAPYTWDIILLTSISFVVFCSAPAKKKKDDQKGDKEEDHELEEKTAET